MIWTRYLNDSVYQLARSTVERKGANAPLLLLVPKPLGNRLPGGPEGKIESSAGPNYYMVRFNATEILEYTEKERAA